MISNKIQYNPDVLDALANLSSDEVFTPPKIANEMLDLLPKEIWSDSSIKILDPACKSWVFLREAAKRFIKWLENEFPDLQERIDHIMTKQLFWIWITNLTALLSRRSLYCSKNAKFDPNDDLWKYSICTKFGTNDWNIWFDRVEHERKNGNCIHCGASQSEYERNEGLETHAYKFIHSTPEEINALFGLDPKMRFDVIIWNPPYQLNDWWNWASASPLYNYFVQQAKKLSPKYLSMIMPARWYAWWKWLDDFRDTMLHDNRISHLVDFRNSKDCFSWVDIKWWVCYFLWDNNYKWDCIVTSYTNWEKTSELKRSLVEKDSDTFIRYNEAISILKKIQKFNEKSFSEIVSSRKPFWFATNFIDFKEKEFHNSIKIYANQKQWYVDKNLIEKNKEWIDKYKLIVPKAIWSWEMWIDKIKPIKLSKNSCCTETYVVFWPFDDEFVMENVLSYTQTKFFAFMMWLRKVTQDATAKVYSFVPMQDFSKSRTDEELYKKYDLTQEEIDYIETMIKPID